MSLKVRPLPLLQIWALLVDGTVPPELATHALPLQQELAACMPDLPAIGDTFAADMDVDTPRLHAALLALCMHGRMPDDVLPGTRHHSSITAQRLCLCCPPSDSTVALLIHLANHS